MRIITVEDQKILVFDGDYGGVHAVQLEEI
jgi:hypothetical protein